MTVRRFGIAAIAAMLSLSIRLSPALADGISAAERETVLSLHNSYRAQHCVPALTWSAELAASAQKWADNCSLMFHSTRGKSSLGRVGENLAWGGDRTGASAVDAWYKEVDVYNYAKPGFAASTGHFTQMVWRDTKQIGCGVSKCYLGAARFWVCHYAPQGNWAGKFPQNVPKRCK
jgi:uncharacterized protein YkwD